MRKIIRAASDSSSLAGIADMLKSVIDERYGDVRVRGSNLYVTMYDVGTYKITVNGTNTYCVEYLDDGEGTCTTETADSLKDWAIRVENISRQASDESYSVNAATETDDTELEHPDQEFDSAATSINSNKLPAIYKLIKLEPGTVGVDFGGGRFDNAVEYLRDKDVTLCVYDPYNRSAEHNADVLRILKENGGADFAVNSNVLNVIKESEARAAVLKNIKKITKPGAPIYITVYEGKGDGKEGATKAGYQLNRKTADYLEEVQAVFPDAVRKGKLIRATNSGGSTNSSKRVTKRYIAATTTHYKDRTIVDTSDGRYTVKYNSVDTEDVWELWKQFEAVISKITPYDDANYFWALLKHGTVYYFKGAGGRPVDSDSYFNADDLDIEITEWADYIVNTVIDDLVRLNKAVAPVMVHMSKQIGNSNVSAAATRYKNRKVLDTSDGRYTVKYNSVDTDDAWEQWNAFEAAIAKVTSYDVDNYYWALLKQGTIHFYQGSKGRPVNTAVYFNADDMDIETTEWVDSVINTALDELVRLNDSVPSVGVHMSTQVRKSKVAATTRSAGASRIIKSNRKVQANQVVDHMDDLKDELDEAVIAALQEPEFGFDAQDAVQYSRVDVYKENAHDIVVDIGAEVDYDGLMQLCEKLNPIVQQYDPDSYFEPVDPGLIGAWLNGDKKVAAATNTDDQAAIAAAYDDRFNPPDTPEVYDANDQIGDIELTLTDVLIEVKADGTWDYVGDDDFRNPDRGDGQWYDDMTGLYITDPTGLLEDSWDVLDPFIPSDPGQYKISCDLDMEYNITGLQSYDADTAYADMPTSDLVTDDAKATLNTAASQVTHFKARKV